MTEAELILFWVTLSAYGLAAASFLFGLIRKGQGADRVGVYLAAVGLAAHVAGLTHRSLLSGHLPGAELYELNSLGALLTVFVFLLVQARRPALRVAGSAVSFIAALLLLFGYLSNPEISPLPPEFRSEWFFVHIFFSFLAFACYATSASASGLYLWKSSYPDNGFLKSRVPSLEILDALSFRLVSFGFVFHAMMVISGSFWAYTAWGSYWSWDPIETWSLVTWLIYGIYLHLYLTLGWRGRRMALLNIIALVVIVLNFWGLGHLPGQGGHY